MTLRAFLRVRELSSLLKNHQRSSCAFFRPVRRRSLGPHSSNTGAALDSLHGTKIRCNLARTGYFNRLLEKMSAERLFFLQFVHRFGDAILRENVHGETPGRFPIPKPLHEDHVSVGKDCEHLGQSGRWKQQRCKFSFK